MLWRATLPRGRGRRGGNGSRDPRKDRAPQFPDDEIYAVNYIMDDAPKAYIRGYSLQPADFVLEG